MSRGALAPISLLQILEKISRHRGAKNSIWKTNKDYSFFL